MFLREEGGRFLAEAASRPGLKECKMNESAGGVMGMIQQIINNAEAMETEAVRSEEDAQKAYEHFVKETTFPSRRRPRPF